MIQFDDYSAFRIAAANGHLNLVRKIADELCHSILSQLSNPISLVLIRNGYRELSDQLEQEQYAALIGIWIILIIQGQLHNMISARHY